jgi:hypothetical protein
VSKKKINQLAPPLPKGEFYSMYDVEKSDRWRYCKTCLHYFSEDEAYEFHTRAGHITRTVDEWEKIREQAKRVDQTGGSK